MEEIGHSKTITLVINLLIVVLEHIMTKRDICRKSREQLLRIIDSQVRIDVIIIVMVFLLLTVRNISRQHCSMPLSFVGKHIFTQPVRYSKIGYRIIYHHHIAYQPVDFILKNI